MSISQLSFASQRIGAEFIQKANISPKTNHLIELLKNSAKKITSNFASEINHLNTEKKIVTNFLKSYQKSSVIGLAVGKLNLDAISRGKIKPEEQVGKENFKIISSVYAKFGPIGKNKSAGEEVSIKEALTPNSPTGSILDKYEKKSLGGDKFSWMRKEMTPAELESSMVFRQPQGQFNIWDGVVRSPVLSVDFNKKDPAERINNHGQSSLYTKLALEANADLASRKHIE